MKKLLITGLSLIAMQSYCTAQITIDNTAGSCDVVVNLFAHDMSNSGCGDLIADIVYVAAGNTASFTSILDVNSSSCSSSYSGPGWYIHGSAPLYCISSTSGTDYDGAVIRVIGASGAPMNIGNSSCHSNTTDSKTDCTSSTLYADWDDSNYPAIKIKFHY